MTRFLHSLYVPIWLSNRGTMLSLRSLPPAPPPSETISMAQNDARSWLRLRRILRRCLEHQSGKLPSFLATKKRPCSACSSVLCCPSLTAACFAKAAHNNYLEDLVPGRLNTRVECCTAAPPIMGVPVTRFQSARQSCLAHVVCAICVFSQCREATCIAAYCTQVVRQLAGSLNVFNSSRAGASTGARRLPSGL